jgi:hypothetical protein
MKPGFSTGILKNYAKEVIDFYIDWNAGFGYSGSQIFSYYIVNDKP